MAARIHLDVSCRMPKSAKKLEAEIAAAIAKPRKRKAPRSKAKTAHQLKTEWLDLVAAFMHDATGERGWKHYDQSELEKWIGDMFDADDFKGSALRAYKTLIDQSVSAENAGAASERVYEWNDIFRATYWMNIDDGMSPEEARDSAINNASDTVKLKPNEHGNVDNRIPS